MRTSVVISTYTKERFNDILKCIESLLNQTTPPNEIILVLDPDEELIYFYKENLKEYPVKIVKSPKKGLSSARNAGIEHSKGDIIAFIDDDAWAHPKWIENLLRNFKDKEVVGVGGKIIPYFEGGRPKWLTDDLLWIVGCTFPPIFSEKKEIRNPIGANMAFRREVFEKVGLFKEGVGRVGKVLLGAEETELSMRIKSKYSNWRIIYEPDAIVYHRIPESRITFRYVLRRAFYEGVSKALLSKEYEIAGEYSYLIYLIQELAKDIIRFRLESFFARTLIILSVGVGYSLSTLSS